MRSGSMGYEYIYKLADRNIRICSCYEYVHRMCADYRVDGSTGVETGKVGAGVRIKPDFSVHTDQADIDYEREKSEKEKALTGMVHLSSDPYLETLAIYRQIAEQMPFYDTILFHGSCVAVDGVGYLFTAKSGTGKSTHTRLWREFLGDRAVMINDDKPLIRVAEDVITIYGTPWNGKDHLSTNTSVPLKAICILTRAEQNTITRISTKEAYSMLLQQAYRPMDRAALGKTMELIDGLSQKVELWRLGCNISLEAAEIAYQAMSRQRVGDD